jgi:hypothetical protein
MIDAAVARRRARRMQRPRAGLLAIVAGFVLLTAACSGTPSHGGSSGSSAAGHQVNPSPGSGGSAAAGRPTRQAQLAYSECMRSHGVPGVPSYLPSALPGAQPSDSPSWQPVKSSGPGPGSPQFQAAQHACRSLMPPPRLVSG